MTSVTIAEAQSQFVALITRAEAGETIAITRDGETIATLAPSKQPREAVDASWLYSITSQMRSAPVDAGTFMRQLRDEERF